MHVYARILYVRMVSIDGIFFNFTDAIYSRPTANNIELENNCI